MQHTLPASCIGIMDACMLHAQITLALTGAFATQAVGTVPHLRCCHLQCPPHCLPRRCPSRPVLAGPRACGPPPSLRCWCPAASPPAPTAPAERPADQRTSRMAAHMLHRSRPCTNTECILPCVAKPIAQHPQQHWTPPPSFPCVWLCRASCTAASMAYLYDICM